MQEKGITKIMDVILYKEDYEGRKPGPEPYLRGFEKMAEILGYPIEPKRCIAIEDDPKNLFKISLKEYKVYFQQSIGDNLNSFLSK